MNEQDFTCQKCGGRKQIFFVRAPWLILGTILWLVALFVCVRPQITNPTTLALVTYVGIAIALVSALSTLRIRCLECEPQFKDKSQ